MSFLDLLKIEFMKVKRSKIVPLIFIAPLLVVVSGVASLSNYFTPEYTNAWPAMFIQSALVYAYYLLPFSMIVVCVMIAGRETGNNGILKMLALPLAPGRLCLAKFVVLLSFGVIQLLMTAAAYYISAAAATHLLNYPFILPLSYVLPITGEIYLASLPMAAVFWMLATLIRTPVFSIGIGLAAIVPSVLMINTKIWFAYPMCYPFYTLMTEYGRLSPGIFSACLRPLPLIPASAAVTVLCLTVSCIQFGHSERSE